MVKNSQVFISEVRSLFYSPKDILAINNLTQFLIYLESVLFVLESISPDVTCSFLDLLYPRAYISALFFIGSHFEVMRSKLSLADNTWLPADWHCVEVSLCFRK